MEFWNVERFRHRFFHRKIRKQDLAVVLCTMFGIALFFLDRLSPGYVLGNIVGIASGMFMAAMYVAVGEINEEERFSGILNGLDVETYDPATDRTYSEVFNRADNAMYVDKKAFYQTHEDRRKKSS